MTAKKATHELYDFDEVSRAIRALVPEGSVTELRLLNASTRTDRYVRTLAGYFDNAERLAESLAAIRSFSGAYFVLNELNPALLARSANKLSTNRKMPSTSDADITGRRWLPIDLDAVRPSGISATDAEHDAATEMARAVRTHLVAQGWPEPVAGDSGNGAHLLWRIDLPADDGGLVERCLKALAQRFTTQAVKVDTGVYNPARIWKLYGTLAGKGDSTTDRPHRMAKLLFVPASQANVTREQLEALAWECEVSESKRPSSRPPGNGTFNLEAFIIRHGLQVKQSKDWNGQQGRGRRWEFSQSPLCGHNDGAAWLVQHAGGAVSAGCQHESCVWTWRDLRQQLEPGCYDKPDVSKLSKEPPSTQKTPPEPPTPYVPFPSEVLPEPVRGFVQTAAKAIGCDESYLALPLLTALGAAIGNTRRIQLKRNWLEPPILWTAIVGESGTLKTPAFKVALRSIRSRQQDSLEQHAKDVKQFESDFARWEKAKAAWKRAKGDSEPPDKPEYPQAERFIVSDTTVEALAPILLANPRGLLLARDELAGWLGSFDRYSSKGGGDAAHWLSMFNAENVIVDRKTGIPRTIFVPKAAVAVTGGIQPGVLNRALGSEHRESGLAARLLLSCPPRRRKRWTEAEVHPDVMAAVGQLFPTLLELTPLADEYGKLAPVVTTLDRQAKMVWREYYAHHAKEQAELAGDLAAAWSKLEAYAARLALIVHFVRWAAEDVQDQTNLDADSMTTGIKLTEWFKQEARRVYSILDETDTDRDRRQIVEWIRGKGGTVTVRETQQGHRRFRTSEDAELALKELAAAGLGEFEKQSERTGPGRPKMVFRLPSTLSTSTELPKTRRIANTVDVDSVDSPQNTFVDGDDWGEI